MARDDPLACLITFRCYGTWRHGDDRGSFQRSTPGVAAEEVGASPSLDTWERLRLAHPPARLDESRRTVIGEVIAEACAFRGWRLHAINVRTEHVHLVVSASEPPEHVLNALKARCTRDLRDRGLAGPGERLWSRHGSTRYLWDEAAVETACRYVRERQ